MKVLTLSPTNKCPLQCKHCGPESSPQDDRGNLDIDQIRKLLKEFSELDIRNVNFTGGEPMLLGHKLVDLVEYSTKLGIRSRVTTSGYWAKRMTEADSRTEKLAAAGLTDFYLSVSDAHLEFTNLANLLNVVRSARKYGINSFIGIGTQGEGSNIFGELVKLFKEENEEMPMIHFYPIIPFGRAAKSFKINQLQLVPIDQISGPCNSILNHPTVHSNGDITPCASVFSRDVQALNVGNVKSINGQEAMSLMKNNKLFMWIHTIGLVALREMLQKNYRIETDKNYVNICHLCGDLLTNPEVISALKKEGIL